MVRGAFYTDLWGTWMPSETFDASLERHRVRCLLSWVHGSWGNLLCLSRAPQIPLRALWSTRIRREAAYASLERHRVRCLLSGVQWSAGKPSMPISLRYIDAQGSLLCRSLDRLTPISGVHVWIRRETFYADLRGT